MSRILLIEDSEAIKLLVTEILQPRHEVVSVSAYANVIKAIHDPIHYDLILLDVMLPDIDGFQLLMQLKNFKQTSETPVILLTGRSNITDKVTGFSLGAEDYIVKPFEPLEFRARIESKIQKYKRKKEVQENIRKGNIHLKLAFQKAFYIKKNIEIDLNLSSIEFKLLYYFVTHEEHVVSRNQLLNFVWGENVFVIDRTVDKHISSLRKKLLDNANYIQTVPRSGYRFTFKDIS